MAIECVILDADNTLYSTKKASRLGYMSMFTLLSGKCDVSTEVLETAFKDVVKTVKDSPSPQTRRKEYSLSLALQNLGIDNVALIPEALELFWSVVVKTIEPAEKVQETLAYLATKYTVVIASDEFQKSLIPKLQQVVGSLDQFAMIITPELAGEMKPSPAYYQHVLDDLYFSPQQCVVVGDRWEYDLRPAMKLGMETILVGPESKGTPTKWIKTLKELHNLL